jgi:hypothetical protein
MNYDSMGTTSISSLQRNSLANLTTFVDDLFSLSTDNERDQLSVTEDERKKDTIESLETVKSSLSQSHLSAAQKL